MAQEELTKLRNEIIELTEKYNKLNSAWSKGIIDSMHMNALQEILRSWNDMIKPIEDLHAEFFEVAASEESNEPMVRWKPEWNTPEAQKRVSRMVITCLANIQNQLSIKVEEEVAKLNNFKKETDFEAMDLRNRIEELHRFFNMVNIQAGIVEDGNDI
jgi:hypothetical protein